jgi:hypothetical protein
MSRRRGDGTEEQDSIPVANVTLAAVLSRQHRKMGEPGTAQS